MQMKMATVGMHPHRERSPLIMADVSLLGAASGERVHRPYQGHFLRRFYLRHSGRRSVYPVNKQPQYIAIFNRVVIAAGLDVSATKTHSLRSGGATAMLRAGVPAYVITKLGRWKSACWQTYTWASHALVQHAHNALGTILPDNTPVDFDAVRRDVTLH